MGSLEHILRYIEDMERAYLNAVHFHTAFHSNDIARMRKIDSQFRQSMLRLIQSGGPEQSKALEDLRSEVESNKTLSALEKLGGKKCEFCSGTGRLFSPDTTAPKELNCPNCSGTGIPQK